jgi:hypothetical protein
LNTPQNTAAAPASAGLAFPASGQAWYLVFVLLIFYIFSFIDRQIIALLVEPMKRDLHVSDTMIGLMQGLAFAGTIAALLLWRARGVYREKVAATAEWL